jgi:exodeoxyribonuclease VII large subunit
MDRDGKLTVSEITELIKQNLEGAFSHVTVEGELSNCRPSSTGHLYFTLKDSSASLSCVMFRNRLRYLHFQPRDGMLLRARGSISVYAQRGAYQLIAEEMEVAGEGDILAKLEERKKKLAAEGLFDQDAKQAIPAYPQTVGVVSSPTGAAVQDVINVLSRRAAGIHLLVLPAPVQGAEAAPIIARRIEQANQWHLADVLIVGRGGGSLEDLLPFSEEVVVRAVAASQIPVISAVGHEIDWALSDYAADLRAPTPSAAAELVSGNREELRNRVGEIEEELKRSMDNRIERIRLALKPFTPEEIAFRFRSIYQALEQRYDDAREELLDAMKERLDSLKQRLKLAVTGLEAASPRAVLERGFSVVLNTATGKIVKSCADVSAGSPLEIHPAAGVITAVVKDAK